MSVYIGDNKITLSKEDILNLVYPIGSIYVSTNTTSPETTLGGSWTELESGYFLEAAGSGGTGGSTKSAGLPNITGQQKMNWGDGSVANVIFKNNGTGAFTGSGSTGTKYHNTVEYTTTNGYDIINFSAANSNSIYGNSSTVQPKSTLVHMWKRTA